MEIVEIVAFSSSPPFTVNPLVKVPDQMVATSVGSNVSMSCVVESSPKSVNMWMRRGKDGARKSEEEESCC